MRKPNNYWTKERCQEEALKYETRKDFNKNCVSAYNRSVKNKWIDEICSHMIRIIHKKGFWTKEKCQEEALKYQTKNEFENNCGSGYDAARRYKWIDEICSHMVKIKNEKGFWTKDKCQEEALKYDDRTLFNKESGGAYHAAHINGWLNEICSHMKIKGNKYKRCIYAYEFSDNFVYVGLTYNIRERNLQHLKNGPVYDHIQLNNNYKLKQLTEYIPIEDAKEKEIHYIKIYKERNYKLLNSANGGELGGGIKKWSFEKCIDDAKKYKNKNEYRKSKSYRSATRNKWLDEIYDKCNFKKTTAKKFGYWSKEQCILESEKYTTLKDFKYNSRSAYSASAIRHNWINEIIELRKWN